MYPNDGSDIPLPSVGCKQVTRPTHTQGEEVTQGMNSRRWGHWGPSESLPVTKILPPTPPHGRRVLNPELL